MAGWPLSAPSELGRAGAAGGDVMNRAKIMFHAQMQFVARDERRS